MQKIYTLLFLFSFLLVGCAGKSYKDISYLTEVPAADTEIPTLNVFSPKKNTAHKHPVFVFVHGGNWDSGKKELYGFIGRNFAKKDVVTVIPGYTLSPNANYDTMADQIASAVKWAKKNISEYGGDPNQIFLSGHSAGGHLITLVATNPKYLNDSVSIKGLILNDAAALDMYSYLLESPPTTKNSYLTTWTDDPENWKDASPIYFVDEDTPPMLLYLGSKTYSSIEKYNQKFVQTLNQYQPDLDPIIINKKHIPMVTQLFWPWNNRYKEMLEFMEGQ